MQIIRYHCATDVRMAERTQPGHLAAQSVRKERRDQRFIVGRERIGCVRINIKFTDELTTIPDGDVLFRGTEHS